MSRILFITHYSALYGANKSLLNLLEGLKAYEIEPLIVVPKEGEICKVLEQKGVKFVIQDFYWWSQPEAGQHTKGSKALNFFRKWRSNRYKKKRNALSISELERKLEGFKPDIIYSNSSVFNFGLLISRKLQKSHIWYLRESLDHYNLEWLYNKKIIKKTFLRSQVVVAVSDFLKRNFEENIGIKNIKVIYNGILSKNDLLALDRLVDQKRKVKSETSLIFGIVGLIHSKKNQVEALKAFAIVSQKHATAKLIIVGQGDQTQLRELAEELGVMEKVEFWGHIENPFDAYLEMDVFLMCSRMEGFGRVTAEAMAARLPVVGFAEGGTKEIIEEGVNGLFYSTDHEELAQKMLFLCENPEERMKMGANGRKMFEDKYLVEDHAEKFFQVIRNFR